nr:hypothetical protein [Chloroflexia bacterium]
MRQLEPWVPRRSANRRLTFVILLSIVLQGHPPVHAQGTPIADPSCVAEAEPNDQPPDAMRLPDTTACVAGDNPGGDQDLVTWTVDAVASAQLWDISATGIPGQAVSVNVYPLDPDAAEGTVPELLLKADGGAGQAASLNGLYWPAVDYLVGVATSGPGTYMLTFSPSVGTPEAGEEEP